MSEHESIRDWLWNLLVEHRVAEVHESEDGGYARCSCSPGRRFAVFADAYRHQADAALAPLLAARAETRTEWGTIPTAAAPDHLPRRVHPHESERAARKWAEVIGNGERAVVRREVTDWIEVRDA